MIGNKHLKAELVKINSECAQVEINALVHYQLSLDQNLIYIWNDDLSAAVAFDEVNLKEFNFFDTYFNEGTTVLTMIKRDDRQKQKLAICINDG